MSSAPHVERFKGTGWEECHGFIAAIRTRAFWEGKQRDSAWKADFAATLFFGHALRWHNKLPEDVRDDWSKLETALLDRWPPQGDDNESEIQPTPAAAPSLNRYDKANHPLQGVLKVVVDQSNMSYYVKRPVSGSACALSKAANEALRVRCDSLPNATLLERIDHWCQSRLAAQWTSENPVVREGSTQYARLTCVDSDNLKSAWRADRPFQLLACTVLANGEVISAFKKDSTSQITLVPFVESSLTLCLAVDPEAYAKEWPDEKRAKFFIEPTE